MARFEVGKTYGSVQNDYIHRITVTKRTAKMIRVRNLWDEWRMLVRRDENGDEYVRDSRAGDWADLFTFKAIWEEE